MAPPLCETNSGMTQGKNVLTECHKNTLNQAYCRKEREKVADIAEKLPILEWCTTTTIIIIIIIIGRRDSTVGIAAGYG
jgi:hypothetical protein